jgi:hypothetical protein
MLSRPVRALGHVGAVTLLSGTAFVATAGTGSAAAPSRPDSYGGDATASTIHVQGNRKPGLFPAVDNPFNSDLPYASTSIDSSGAATASAAPYTPGQGVLGVPALLCVFAGPLCQKVTPPDYPFLAYAQYPSKQDAKATVAPGTVQAGAAQVTLGKTVAHADPDRVAALTEAGGAGIAGALSADEATAHSEQHFVGATLVSSTESIVKGLDIAAKVLHIDSVRSVATSKVDGAKVSAATATTTVSGASVAGTPVTIDSKGIHAAGHGDDGAATHQVNAALKALAQAGVSVRQLGSTHKAHKGVAVAQTGGLLITFTRPVNVKNPVPPLPCPPAPLPCVSSGPNPNGTYFGSVTLAGAGVSAFATPASPAVSVGPVDVPSPQAGGPQPVSHGGGGGTAPAPPGSDAVAGGTGHPRAADAAGRARHHLEAHPHPGARAAAVPPRRPAEPADARAVAASERRLVRPESTGAEEPPSPFGRTPIDVATSPLLPFRFGG